MTSNIKFATWSSSPNDSRLKILKSSAKNNNINIDVIPCFSLMDKIPTLLNYLSTLDDSDLLCVTDGYDVIYSGDKTEIVKQFKSLNSKVVSSGEFSYLSSRLIIGCVENLKE